MTGMQGYLAANDNLGGGGGGESDDTSTWLMLFRRLGKQEKPPTSP